MDVVVRRYIDVLIIIITFPYSTCISSFFGSSIPTYFFVHLKHVFSFFMLYAKCICCMHVQLLVRYILPLQFTLRTSTP